MFLEVGFSEMLVVGVIALLVVKPKDLPLLMRKVSQFVNKMRNMANDFKSSFDDLARQAELDELKREIDSLRNINPLNEINYEIQGAVNLANDVKDDDNNIVAPDVISTSQSSDENNKEIIPLKKVAKPRKKKLPAKPKSKPSGQDDNV